MKRRQALGGRLDRYVAAHFLGSYALAMGILVGLFVVLDAAGNLEKWMEDSSKGPPASLLQVSAYYLLNLPYVFLQIAPFVTLMAAMFTVNQLLKKNELTPMMSAGVSSHRTLLPVYLGAVLAGVAMLGVREASGRWIAAPRDALLHNLRERAPEVVHRGVIVRHLDGSWAIFDAYRPDPEGGGGPEVTGLTVKLRRDGSFNKIEAASARWDGDCWQLEDGLRTELAFEGGIWQVDSTPIRILEDLELEPSLVETYRRSRTAPLELTFSEVSLLLDREPDQPAWATLWHYHLTFALACLILVMVGVPLMFTHERGKGAERLALGGLLCVFYFAMDFVLRTLGLNGSVSPVVAAWTPVLVFGTVGIFLTESMRS